MKEQTLNHNYASKLLTVSVYKLLYYSPEWNIYQIDTVYNLIMFLGEKMLLCFHVTT